MQTTPNHPSDGGFKGTVRVAYMCELHCDVSLYKRTLEGGREGLRGTDENSLGVTPGRGL